MKDTSDKIKNITTWLNDSGFPLEMEVASIFQKNKCHIEQSHFFEDPETKVSREIDIFAGFTEEIFEKKILHFRFFVECKSHKDKPWLAYLFPPNNIISHFPIPPLFLNAAASEFLFPNCDEDEEVFHSIFSGRAPHCYAVNRAFTTGEDVAFKGITSSIKAAESSLLADHSEDWLYIQIYIPMVVISQELYGVQLRADSTLDVKRIPYSVLLTNQGQIGNRIGVIIMPKENLMKYVQSAKKTFKRLLEYSKSEFRKLDRIHMKLRKDKLLGNE